MTALTALLEITVYSALLYGALMGFRRLTRGKASPRLRHMLWFLLAARLLLPVTLAAPVALFTVPERPAAVYTATMPAPQQVRNAATVGSTDATLPMLTAVKRPLAPAVPLVAAWPATPWDALQRNWPGLLLGAWSAGAAAMGANLLRLTLQRNRQLRKECFAPPPMLESQMRSLARSMGLRACPRLLLCPGIASPCLTTGTRPALLLPADMAAHFPQEQIAYGLGHELAHMRRGDHVVELVWNILLCVHWFNPFVWLAVRAVREDMELACDADLVRPMDAGQRAEYARMLLALFSGQPGPTQALGMAQGGVRRTAERRIRGVFAAGGSGRGMKAAAAALTAVLVLGCFTTACQPTPAKPAVINKNDGKLQEKLTQTATPAPVHSAQPYSGETAPALPTLRGRMGIPETWQYEKSSNDGAMHVRIDATIEVPDVQAAAVYRVKVEPFTLEQIKKLHQALLGGAPLYEPANPSREHWEEQILITQQELAAAKEAGDKDYQKKMEGELAHAIKQFAETPETPERKPMELVFNQNHYFQDIQAEATVNGRDMMLVVGNGNTSNMIRVGRKVDDCPLSAEYYQVSSALDPPEGVKLAREQAVEQAAALVAQIDAEMKPISVGTATGGDSSRGQAWMITFTRTLGGMPSNVYIIDEKYAENFNPDYESLKVGIDDEGLVFFTWAVQTPAVETINSDAALLSFSEVQDIVAQTLYRNALGGASTGEGNNATYNPQVSRMVLGLTRVAYKDHPGEFLLVPSWDVYGMPLLLASAREDGKTGDGPGTRIVLTLNALDGSIIDTRKGY